MFAFLCLYGVPAFARPADCANYQSWREWLFEDHAEIRTHVGLSLSKQIVVELFENPETHSFTILVTDPYGVSCPVIGGEYWEPVGDEK